jgi:glycosyltransferase involved in cell wall biosynthesis
MSADLPTVSIITPSYNQADFLESTIRSVLEQGYPELEYCVVDGGSSDGSQEIIRRYASRLAWWVSERDRGQAEAINKGFARASGEIIAWLNSDDLYLPGAITQAVAVLQANPDLGMVYGDAITIDPQGRPLNILAFPDWKLQDLLAYRIICQPAVFIRRSVLEKGGYLDLNYHYMLDHHLWLRLASQAPFLHQPRLWAAARHHPQAKNLSQAPGFGREALRLLDWIQKQSDLAPLAAQNIRRVKAGAYRLNARYLLDGGLSAQALRSYARAFLYGPAYTLQHWRRVLYALASLITGPKLAPATVTAGTPGGAGDHPSSNTSIKDGFMVGSYSRLQNSRQSRARQQLAELAGIQDWPGILL